MIFEFIYHSVVRWAEAIHNDAGLQANVTTETHF